MSKKLIITLEYPPQIGGIASYVKNLAGQFDSNAVIVYAPKMKGDKEFDVKNSWKTLRHDPYWFWIWPQWLRLYFQIKKIVETEKIAEIFLHHTLPVGYVTFLIKKIKKIPYTLFLHGSDIYFASKNRWKLNNFRRVCASADNVVVNSLAFKDQLESLVEKVARITVLYPCPAEMFFAPPPPAEKLDTLRHTLALTGKKVIISVARLVERKGHALFFKSFVEILKEVPNAVWVIVGGGEEKPYLVSLVQKYNLQGVVRFLDTIPMEELPIYYYLSDVFLLLTHKDKDGVEEAWGTVFLEAAACGLPVLAGKSGGVEEAVVNNETGLVIDVHQEQNIVSSMVKMLKDKDMRVAMGQKARARAEKEFRWSEQVKKIL